VSLVLFRTIEPWI